MSEDSPEKQPVRSFFNPWAPVDRHGGRLPHWQQAGMTVFVTFRLADSLPQSKLDALRAQKREWLAAHPEPWAPEEEREYLRLFAGRIETWLDRNYGSCVLARPALRKLVADALRFFDGERYRQHAWVLMPNHVHALFTLDRERTLDGVLHSWKSYTAHKVQEDPAAPKPLWQEDYFDRIIRNEAHFARTLRYIRRNPANCRPNTFEVWEHPAHAAY
ncbi:MAG: transposase [Opitutales bacterium]